MAGVDLDVCRGECCGLLGPNGAGKTTIVRLAYGATRRTAGELRVLGLDPERDGPALRFRVGVVSQDNNLDQDLTVRENLQVFARFYALTARESRRRINELLNFLELTPQADAPIAKLSGGMQRRLVIARALLHGPEMLFLDEPTTGLDPQVRRMLWRVVRELTARGLGVLLTTHYMEEAAQLSDRVVVLHKGKKVAEGPPDELVREKLPRHLLELDLRPGDDPAALEREAGAGRFEMGEGCCRFYDDDREKLFAFQRRFDDRAPRLRPTNLEDVFLTLTGRRLDE